MTTVLAKYNNSTRIYYAHKAPGHILSSLFREMLLFIQKFSIRLEIVNFYAGQ